MKTDRLMHYISFDEILRFLNYKGQPISESDQSDIEAILDETLKVASFKHATAACQISITGDQIALLDANGQPTDVIISSDLSAFLAGATQLVMCAVTLGHVLSQRIQQVMHTEPSKAVILDVCASVVTDAYCDMLQDEITQSTNKSNHYCTQRFSPGYGDLPMSGQSVFAKHLMITKRIGVHVTDHFQLIPEKSVIFVMGVSNAPFRGEMKTCSSNCKSCKLESCQFRRSL